MIVRVDRISREGMVLRVRRPELALPELKAIRIKLVKIIP